MELVKWFPFLIFKAVLGSISTSPTSPQRVNISHALWDGVAVYIAVERTAVQEKLDAFQNIEINNQRAPKLYMPTTPVFGDLLSHGQHVVYVDFGFIDSLDFAGEPSISSHGSESAVIIPFLADSPNGVPKYALALGQVYQRDRGAIQPTEIAFPYIGIDQFSLTETEVVWRNGCDELRASFIKSNPCKAVPYIRRHVFEYLIDEDLDFSFSQPDLDYCVRNSLEDHHVCKVLNSIRSGVEKAGANVCQYYQPPWERTCGVTFLDNVIVTGGFRDLLLLRDGPINVVSSEGLYGEYVIGLKYPCME